MSDLQIDGWLRWNGFYHATNVYRCQGLSEEQSRRRLSRSLGRYYSERHVALSNRLRERYRQSYNEQAEFLAFGYAVTERYCQRIRFVVSDLLRGTGELERRLGLAS